MDDLIIIILTLVILVIGAFGQMKKKRVPQTENQQPGKPMDFWDFLEMNDKAPENENTVPQPTETIEEVNIPKAEPAAMEVDFEEGSPVFENKINPTEEMGMQEKNSKKSKLMESFSLKKAVIYSEILNRKYN